MDLMKRDKEMKSQEAGTLGTWMETLREGNEAVTLFRTTILIMRIS